VKRNLRQDVKSMQENKIPKMTLREKSDNGKTTKMWMEISILFQNLRTGFNDGDTWEKQEQLHAFFTSVPNGQEWSASSFGHFTPGK
jgi:hypothetical protein